MMSHMVFFDMDGVLCDFVGASAKLHGITTPYDQLSWNFWQPVGIADEQFWEPLCQASFWESLPVLADGMRILTAVAERGRPIGILSNGICPGSVDGKRRWLAKHCPGLKPVIFTDAKWTVAQPGRFLIDDHTPNCELFELSGGTAIVMPRPWNQGKMTVEEIIEAAASSA
jgi:hypothetical protein